MAKQSDEQPNEQEILLVKEKGKNKLNVVKGLDEEGNLQTVPPNAENEQDFFKINKQGDMLENFFSNFLRQAKDPYNFDFLKIDMKDFPTVIPVLEEMLKDPDSPTTKEFIDPLRVNPEDFAKKEQQSETTENKPDNEPTDDLQPMDVNRIDWAQVEQFIPRATIEENGWLEPLTEGNIIPSDRVMDMQFAIDEVKVPFQGRLSFQEMPDGRIIGVPLPYTPAIPVDRPFLDQNFTQEDQDNLVKYGNLGRILEAPDKLTGEIKTYYVSVDKLTNQIVGLPTECITISPVIKQKELTAEQYKGVVAGERVQVDGMTSRYGKIFPAILQVSAATKSIEFDFNVQKQSQNQTQAQNQAQAPALKKVVYHKTLLSQEVTPQITAAWDANQFVLMEHMKTKEGKPIGPRWVRPNHEKGKFDFFKWNPEKKQTQKERVANSESKTEGINQGSKKNLNKGQKQESAPQQEQKKTKGIHR